MYTLAGALLLLLGVTVAAFQPLWAEATPEPAVSDALSALLPPTNSPQVNPAPRGDDGGHTLYAHGDRLRPLVEETDGAQTLNIYGPGGQIIAQVAQNGSGGQETRHLLADHLGSTRAAVDGEGNVVAHFEYGPHGGTVAAGAAEAEVRYRYTGHPYDESQGLYETPARGYDPTLGRFLSVDPQRQDASPYVYAGNNPVGYLDPTGGGKVPFVMQSGFWGRGKQEIQYAAAAGVTAGNIQNRRKATRALGTALGMDKNQRIADAAVSFGSDPYNPPYAVTHPERLLGLDGINPAREYNERLYWFVGDEKDVELPAHFPQAVRNVREFSFDFADFASEIVLVDFTNSGTGAHDVAEYLRSNNFKFSRIRASRHTRSGARVNDIFYEFTGNYNEALNQMINHVIADPELGPLPSSSSVATSSGATALQSTDPVAGQSISPVTSGERIPVVITPDRGPTSLENGGVSPSNLIELTPGEHTLRIGMPMERGVGIFTYQGVD